MTDRERTPGTAGAPSETASAPSGGKAGKVDSPRHPFRPVVAVMVLTILGLTLTAGFKSYRDLEAARGLERELLDQIAETEERVRILDDRIDRIRNDPAMLERLAREDLGLVRAGDVVIVLPNPRLANRAKPAGKSPVEPPSP